ncbi:MAG: hypothetical protein QM756_07445 [Polyangiaceae bacterium]
MAQASDRGAAVTLYDEAERLMAAGKYAEACPKYAESNRMDPQLGALLHMADCYEKTGQYASAWAAFRDAAELADRRADARSTTAKDRAVTLEPRLNRLTIIVPDAAKVSGMLVRRDGITIGNALYGTPIPIDPGHHEIVVSAPGKLDFTHPFDLSGEGQQETVSVPVLLDAPPAGAAAAPATLSASSDSAPPKAGSTQRILGWTAIGAGGIGVVLGIAFQAKRSSILDERDAICPTGMGCTAAEADSINQKTDQARSASTASLIGFVAGGAFVTGGVLLLVLAPSQSATQSARVTPVLTPSFQGVSVSQAW